VLILLAHTGERRGESRSNCLRLFGTKLDALPVVSDRLLDRFDREVALFASLPDDPADAGEVRVDAAIPLARTCIAATNGRRPAAKCAARSESAADVFRAT
jgi:hypothetical protein